MTLPNTPASRHKKYTRNHISSRKYRKPNKNENNNNNGLSYLYRWNIRKVLKKYHIPPSDQRYTHDVHYCMIVSELCTINVNIPYRHTAHITQSLNTPPEHNQPQCRLLTLHLGSPCLRCPKHRYSAWLIQTELTSSRIDTYLIT